MIDAILYVADFPALVTYLDEHHPELLKRDMSGAMTNPPAVTGFSRTPAERNGDEGMTYARLRDDEVSRWRGMEGVTVLAEAPFTGRGTGDAVYQQVFDDAEKYAIYSRIYPHAPYEVDDGEGGTMTVTPPRKFGIMAGA